MNGSFTPDIGPKGDTTGERATRVRWRIVAVLMAFSFMSWFNRVSMSAAYDERILGQYGISEEAMGWVYSTFFLVYAVFMTPGGWLVDRFGARTALVFMGFGSALFCAMTGLVCGAFRTATGLVVALLVVRGLMGLFTAPIYPASARVVSHWVPFSRRALANGLIQGSAGLGIACTYVALGALMDQFDRLEWPNAFPVTGWPTAFLVTGGVTGLLAFLWSAWSTNDPAEHRAVNQAELRLIKENDLRPTSKSILLSGWGSLLRNRSLICLTLSYGAIGYFEYLFFFWMHYYFEDQLKLGKIESRWYIGIVNLSFAVGMPLGGWLSDRLLHRYGHRLGRTLVPVAGMLAGAILLQVGLLASQPAWVVTWFALALGAVGACEAPFWTTAVELGGRRGGTSAAICNTGGNVGGFLAPIVTPWISALYGWPYGITLGSIICLAGVCLWLWINPSKCPEEFSTT
jgi:MFS family permease